MTFRCALFFLLGLGCALGTDLEVWDTRPAAGREGAFDLSNGRLTARVDDDDKRSWLELEILPGDPAWLWELRSDLCSFGDSRRPNVVSNAFKEAPRPAGTVQIDWLGATGPVSDYRRSFNIGEGTVTTTWKRDGATFTGTILASDPDDLILVHLRVDKPGALSFRVSFAGGGPVAAPTGDRGGLRHDGPDFSTRLWVLPFESEVAPREGGMVVKGEGEAMVVVAAGEKGANEVSGALAKLAKTYDGRDEHPDFTLLWRGALERHRKDRQALFDNLLRTPADEGAQVMQRLMWPALFEAHPDAARVGLAGLLAENRNGTVEFHPGLLGAWKNGHAKGWPLAGGLNADLEWTEGMLGSYALHRNAGLPPETVKVRQGSDVVEVRVE